MKLKKVTESHLRLNMPFWIDWQKQKQENGKNTKVDYNWQQCWRIQDAVNWLVPNQISKLLWWGVFLPRINVTKCTSSLKLFRQFVDFSYMWTKYLKKVTHRKNQIRFELNESNQAGIWTIPADVSTKQQDCFSTWL